MVVYIFTDQKTRRRHTVTPTEVSDASLRHLVASSVGAVLSSAATPAVFG